jgi:hypothetical protein
LRIAERDRKQVLVLFACFTCSALLQRLAVRVTASARGEFKTEHAVAGRYAGWGVSDMTERGLTDDRTERKRSFRR